MGSIGDALSDTAGRRGAQFSGLHGLRGVLALWVVVCHTSSGGYGLFQVPRYGGLAVDIFFIMSGFLLMHTHNLEFRLISARQVIRFLSLRFWRTFPVHILTLGEALAVSMLVFRYQPGKLGILRGVVLVDTWYVPSIDRLMNGPIWSLHIEWLGYVGFPWLCWSMLSVRSFRAVTILAIGVVVLETWLMVAGGRTNSTEVVSGTGAFIRMAGGFTLGCILWIGINHPIARFLSGDWHMLIALCATTSILLVVNPIYSLSLLVIIVLLAARPGPITATILGSHLCLYLGRISFALYMVHAPIVRMFQHFQTSSTSDIPGGYYSVAAIATAIVAATLLCVLAEEPLRRYGRRATNTLCPIARPTARQS